MARMELKEDLFCCLDQSRFVPCYELQSFEICWTDHWISSKAPFRKLSHNKLWRESRKHNRGTLIALSVTAISWTSLFGTKEPPSLWRPFTAPSFWAARMVCIAHESPIQTQRQELKFDWHMVFNKNKNKKDEQCKRNSSEDILR